jgi:MFS family permease
MSADSSGIDSRGLRLGPIWLMPGVSYTNVGALLVISFITIAMLTMVGHSNAYILNEHLAVPPSEHGRVVGQMTFYSEIVILLLVGPLGALSDRIGRRSIFALGFVFLGIGYMVYPTATSVEELTLYRLIFAVGAACIAAMLATVLSDYPQEPSRGKLVASSFFLNGLGMVIMVGLFGSLLGWFKDAGAGPIEAGQYAMWCVAGLCVFAALVAAKGLQPSTAQVDKKGPFVASLIDGLAQARNPRLALAYAAGMVSRGDMSVISTFFTLWLTQVGRSRGMDTADALKLGITFFIVLQTSALLWPPVVSFFIDRVDRALALALAMCLAAAGYLTVGFIADPLGPMMYGGAVLMGIGEMSGVLTAQSLVGQEAPAKSRGTVIGAFSFFGALGILTTVLIGGYLFDNWRPSAPFIYMGFVNCVLIVLASITFVLKPRPPAVVVGA